VADTPAAANLLRSAARTEPLPGGRQPPVGAAPEHWARPMMEIARVSPGAEVCFPRSGSLSRLGSKGTFDSRVRTLSVTLLLARHHVRRRARALGVKRSSVVACERLIPELERAEAYTRSWRSLAVTWVRPWFDLPPADLNQVERGSTSRSSTHGLAVAMLGSRPGFSAEYANGLLGRADVRQRRAIPPAPTTTMRGCARAKGFRPTDRQRRSIRCSLATPAGYASGTFEEARELIAHRPGLIRDELGP
jgi:hypothetical protein